MCLFIENILWTSVNESDYMNQIKKYTLYSTEFTLSI